MLQHWQATNYVHGDLPALCGRLFDVTSNTKFFLQIILRIPDKAKFAHKSSGFVN